MCGEKEGGNELGGIGSGPVVGGYDLLFWASGSGPYRFGAVGSELRLEEEEGKGRVDDGTWACRDCEVGSCEGCAGGRDVDGSARGGGEISSGWE